MLETPEDPICKESVFEKIYHSFSKSLHDYLYYKYGELCNPNDTTQEAFIKLWDNCKKVTSAKAKSFLFTVANNIVLNELKHQKVVLKHQQIIPKNHTNENPEFLMEEHQFLERYNSVLANMKEEFRVAFLLSKAEHKKHKEIADLLGITIKVVEYRVYSAFAILKKELEGFKLK